jgi:RimJ/RimL family protein N-acetyltransferase
MRLETERLILREIDAERDFEGWASAMGDAETVRFLGADVMNRAQAWRHMATVIGHWRIRGYGFFSLECKATGEWIGRTGPWFPEGWPAPEIGWTILRQHWGNGYATEAGAACIEFAFRELGWQRVVHCILKGNERSVAVAERLGSALLGTQQGIPGVTEQQVLIYGQECRPQRQDGHPASAEGHRS